jgi:hypothetical protein
MARLTGLNFACASGCAMVIGAAIVPAIAQNRLAALQPNPYAQQFVDNIKRSQDPVTSPGSRLDTMLDDALQAKQVARLSLVIKCNHYDVIEVTYRDGSIKVVEDPRAPSGRNEVVDRDQLKNLAATLPGFTWGELACEE